MNLLNETFEFLKLHEKNFKKDVLWIGGEDFYISKELFLKLADVEYDSGYGGQEVATDLVIVGNGWWLERFEYAGFENWEFRTFIDKPGRERKAIFALCSRQIEGYHYRCTLKEMNKK